MVVRDFALVEQLFATVAQVTMETNVKAVRRLSISPVLYLLKKMKILKKFLPGQCSCILWRFKGRNKGFKATTYFKSTVQTFTDFGSFVYVCMHKEHQSAGGYYSSFLAPFLINIIFCLNHDLNYPPWFMIMIYGLYSALCISISSKVTPVWKANLRGLRV